MLFDKFVNKIIVTGIIIAVDPLHIGSSNTDSLDPTQVDNSVLKDYNGNPLIPGSSLKGVVRSDFEAVLRSIGKKVCDVFDTDDERCATKGAVSEINKDKISDEGKAEIIYSKSCEVCRLFGGRGIASHIEFKDCTYIGERCIFEHRDGVGIDRETGAAKRGAKYEFEVIPKGSRFDFYMTAVNIDEGQRKYLNYIIKKLESGDLCVGGKTTRGLGRIKLENTIKKEITAEDIKKELCF